MSPLLSDFPIQQWLLNMPLALGALFVLLAVTFAIGVRQHRHVVIDAAWGLGFVVVAAVSFFSSASHGDTGRRLLLLVLTALWGIRLGSFLAWRMRDGHEDPRYDALLGKAENRNTYAIKRVYLPQAIVLFLVSMVQQVGMFATGPLTWVAWVGVVVWAIGMFFETVGDWQLSRYKARRKASPETTPRILDTGVWAWTRHPNYFGDSAVWCGLFLITASSWPGVLTVLSPVLMTWALVARTGKALTEKRMKDRPGFAEYAARTSGFFPLPPKRG